MKLDQVMKTLKAKGKPSAAKTYARHGVSGEIYGVSYADLGALEKQLGTDHALALGLWRSGVHEARVLACRVADATAMSRGELERWQKESGDSATNGEVAGLAARMPAGLEVAAAWVDAEGDLAPAAGWSIYARIAPEGELDAATAKRLLARIEKEIGRAGNRTRYSMNLALIAIGGGMPGMTAAALAAAKRIGVVDVDHGDTSCKTPDAASYIAKMVARRKKTLRKA